MSYYAEPDSHIRDKVKVVLEFSNYATGVSASDLAAKKILFLWKLKLKNWKLINWLTFQLIWIDLKTKSR